MRVGVSTFFLIPGLSVALGCDGDEGIPPCDEILVEEVVSMDDEIPWDEEQPPGPDNPVVVPREIADAISQPIVGELEWKAAGAEEYLFATPDEGVTGFTSTLVHMEPVVWSRVPGASGDTLLKCSPTLRFDASINFETDDGVFDEVWAGRAVSAILGGGTVTVEIDARAHGIPEKLNVTRNPEAPEWENETYSHVLFYGTCIDNCGGAPLMTGNINIMGDFPPTSDGEVITESGINIRLAEWSGSPPG